MNKDKSNMLDKTWVRFLLRVFYLTVFVVVWQLIYRSGTFPPLLFPGGGDILNALVKGLQGGLLDKTLYSLQVIGKGILISTILTVVLAALATFSRVFEDFLYAIIVLIDPLPGIALLPLILLWLGMGENAIIFVIIHSVLWPLLLNVFSGFKTVPPIYTEIGQNMGMNRFRLVVSVLLPSTLPQILVGFKTGWSRAWRALISAEMIFGATSGKASGIGWEISQKRNFLDVPGIFAALIVIMIIGLTVEIFLFNMIEKYTVKKWGMVT